MRKVNEMADEETKTKKDTKQPMPKHCVAKRKHFLDNADHIQLEFRTIGGDAKLIGALPCEVKLFKTGSFGYYAHGKVHVEVDGQRIPVQVSMSATVVNSKYADDE
jgi:hypothetical protein